MKRKAIFSTLPCIDGFEVILADTGRTIVKRPTRKSANGVAFSLNNLSQRGGEKAITRAMEIIR